MGVDGARDEQTPALSSDHLSIFSGATQNVAGLVIAALATFGSNVLIARTLGESGLGIVTVATQAAFVLSFATRAGMDMAVLREVAIERGVDRADHLRSLVARACAAALAVSALVGAITFLFAGSVADSFSLRDPDVVRAAALGLPFLALANVWLSATRGLKIMRYTLYVFWAGQPLLWIALLFAGWGISETSWMSVAAYSGSWMLASAAAYAAWRRESRTWPTSPLQPGAMARVLRYAGPRALAALLAQLLFWTDLFILTRYASNDEVGVYSAALRVGQVLVLFLTSVNLMFSPYVADLHNRGERDKLDSLFKSLTRWVLTATIPIALLILVAPSGVMQIFGSNFDEGEAALRIVIAGQIVNVATGSVGFILIMVGRTGWDLGVYAVSLTLDVVVAMLLAPELGMEGAAIANAVTFAVSNGLRVWLVWRFVRIQPYDRHYLRLLLPGGATAVVMALVYAALDSSPLVGLVASAAAGFAVYAATLLAVGLAPGEREALASLRTRLAGR